MTLAELINQRMGIPLPLVVNDFLEKTSKKAVYSHGKLFITQAMWDLLSGATKDGNRDELNALAEAMEVTHIPDQPMGFFMMPLRYPEAIG